MQSFENDKEWTYYGRKEGRRNQVQISAHSKDEADKIKHWKAEKAAIKDRQTKLEASKQVTHCHCHVTAHQDCCTARSGWYVDAPANADTFAGW